MATFDGITGLDPAAKKRVAAYVGGGVVLGGFFLWLGTRSGSDTVIAAEEQASQYAEDIMNWLSPIAGAALTQKYKPGPSGHNGVDYGVGVGTPILAPFDGVILRSQFVDPATVYPAPNAVGMAKWYDPATGKIPTNASQAYWDAASGQNIIMRDSSGKFTISFSHMSHRDVATGDRVTRGQKLGLTGNTGYTFGPHAHVVLRVDGTTVDPLSVPEFAQMFA